MAVAAALSAIMDGVLLGLNEARGSRSFLFESESFLFPQHSDVMYARNPRSRGCGG
jgi:hypothetical protein